MNWQEIKWKLSNPSLRSKILRTSLGGVAGAGVAGLATGLIAEKNKGLKTALAIVLGGMGGGALAYNAPKLIHRYDLQQKMYDKYGQAMMPLAKLTRIMNRAANKKSSFAQAKQAYKALGKRIADLTGQDLQSIDNSRKDNLNILQGLTPQLSNFRRVAQQAAKPRRIHTRFGTYDLPSMKLPLTIEGQGHRLQVPYQL